MKKKIISSIALALTLCLSIACFAACGAKVEKDNSSIDFSPYIDEYASNALSPSDLLSSYTSTVSKLLTDYNDTSLYAISLINTAQSIFSIKNITTGKYALAFSMYDVVTDFVYDNVGYKFINYTTSHNNSSYGVNLYSASGNYVFAYGYKSITRADSSTGYEFSYYAPNAAKLIVFEANNTNAGSHQFSADSSGAYEYDEVSGDYILNSNIYLNANMYNAENSQYETSTINFKYTRGAFNYKNATMTKVVAAETEDFEGADVGSTVEKRLDGKNIGLKDYTYSKTVVNDIAVIAIYNSSNQLVNKVSYPASARSLFVGGKLLYIETKQLPMTSNDYDFSDDEFKYTQDFFMIDLLSSKTEELNFDFYISGVTATFNSEEETKIVVFKARAIENNKTLSDTVYQIAFNGNGKFYDVSDKPFGLTKKLSDNRYLVKSNYFYFLTDSKLNVIQSFGVNEISIDYLNNVLIIWDNNAYSGAVDFNGKYLTDSVYNYNFYSNVKINGYVNTTNSLTGESSYLNVKTNQKFVKAENTDTVSYNYNYLDSGFFIKTEKLYFDEANTASAYYKISIHKLDNTLIYSFNSTSQSSCVVDFTSTFVGNTYKIINTRVSCDNVRTPTWDGSTSSMSYKYLTHKIVFVNNYIA